MSVLIVRVCHASQEPLKDRMDVKVISVRTDATVRSELA